LTSVIVIGGGLAGLSSALALAEAGCRVRLYEKRPHLGGRAASYSLPDGTEVDNCQHVTLGCCTNLEDFYRRSGVLNRIRFFDRIVLFDRERRQSELRAVPLSPPLHLLPSLLHFHSLPPRQRWDILRALWAIVKDHGQADTRATMLDWLRRQRQPDLAIERFWKLLLVSALNENLDRVAAQFGFQVFWQALLANRQGYRVGIPTVPLGQLYEGCRKAIEARGGAVYTRARVQRLCLDGDRVRGVEFEGKVTEEADAYVVAVPPRSLLPLIPDTWRAAIAGLEDAVRLPTAPITGVHLWFDRPVLAEPFAGLIGFTSQWVFNKSALLGSEGDGQYLQVVISASYDLVSRSRQEIVDLCLAELGQLFPAARDAKIRRAVVVKEVEATVSPLPGAQTLGPGRCDSVENLFLAGDWTRTGWPATMESAVRSGYLAAEAVLAAGGRRVTFLQPDLPAQGLSRLCAGHSGSGSGENRGGGTRIQPGRDLATGCSSGVG
jgi:squalene-associated FAD-dependent desaturase